MSRLRVLLVAAACIVALGCATGPLETRSAGLSVETRTPGFSFATDTFAFANLIRERHPGLENIYANYCFVLARGARQFFLFARFDPATPRLDHDGYVDRVKRIASRAPWAPALPPESRVLIPGYANLREFSRAEEYAVKEGLGSRFWTFVHWTNWRVTFPMPPAHQEGVAHEVMERLHAGELVQLLVTNWPKPELNHTVVAYGYRLGPGAVDFDVWDPNDPDAPGIVSFEREHRRFWATRVYATEPGPIRAFRMYYSWFL